MIHFPRSTFTWKNQPWQPDPYYRWAGGFVGTPGQVYHVRFNLEASCTVSVDATGHATEMFVSAPCRSEYTIAARNLFQVPSGEFRYAFSRTHRLNISARPSTEPQSLSIARLSDTFQDHKIDIRTFANVAELTSVAEIVQATLAGDLLNARTTYRDAGRGLTVTVEYPINLININEADGEFQVCTGPLILPDLATWDGDQVTRVFLAHAAFTAFDHAEFILRREVEVAESERVWLDQPQGRDRHELWDAAKVPPNYPPRRPRATVYNEVWALDATNQVLRAENP